MPASLGPFPKLNPEFVVRADPDVIMVGERSASGLAQRPGWAAMRAMREQRVCVFTRGRVRRAGAPGPRMAEAAALMARCLAEQARRTRSSAGQTAMRLHAPLVVGGCCCWPRRCCWRWAPAWAAPVSRACCAPRDDPVALQIVWDIRLPRIAGRLAGRRPAGPGRRGGAGAVSQPAGRPLSAGQCLGRLAGRGAGLAAVWRVAAAPPQWLVRLGPDRRAPSSARCWRVLLTLVLARGVQHTLRLLLAGVVVGVVLGAVKHLILLTRPDILQAMQAFMLGSTGFVGWSACGIMALAWLLCLAGGLAAEPGARRPGLGEATAAQPGPAAGAACAWRWWRCWRWPPARPWRRPA